MFFSLKSFGVALVSIAWILPACAVVESEQLKRLVPDQAYDVREYKTSDGRRVQINFAVTLVYPALAITDVQNKELLDRGWSTCTGTKNEWDTFVDQSRTPEKRIYQYTKAWSRNASLLSVTMRYEATSEAGGQNSKRQPLTNAQHVLILLDKYTNTKQLNEAQRRLGISCSPDRR